MRYSEMAKIKRNLFFKIPTQLSIATSSISISTEELDKLIAMLLPYVDDPVDFKLSIRKQANSRYQLLDSVLQGLKVIYDNLTRADVSSMALESEKKTIAEKLRDQAAACDTGFHDSVNMILERYNLPKSFEELVYRVRHNIVSKVASQFANEVHANNYVYTIANNYGFGVHKINPHDTYDDLEFIATIVTALSNAFDEKNLLPLVLLKELEQQLRATLSMNGYEPTDKAHKEGINPVIRDHLDQSFEHIFSDHPVVVAKLCCREQIQHLETKIKTQKEAAKAALLAWAADYSPTLMQGRAESKNNKFIDYYLGIDKKPLPANWQNEYNNFATSIGNPPLTLSGESEKKYTRHVETKAIYEKTIATESKPLNCLREESDRHEENYRNLFWITHGDEENKIFTDVNWPFLTHYFWHKLKNYYDFELNESNMIDSFLDPSTDPENKEKIANSWVLEAGSRMDLVDMLRVYHYFPEGKSAFIKEQIAEQLRHLLNIRPTLSAILNDLQQCAKHDYPIKLGCFDSPAFCDRLAAAPNVHEEDKHTIMMMWKYIPPQSQAWSIIRTKIKHYLTTERSLDHCLDSLKILSLEQVRDLFNTSKKIRKILLPDLYFNHFFETMQNLPQGHSLVFLEAIEQYVHYEFINITQWKRFAQALDETQRTLFFKLTRPKLLKLIRDNNDLQDVLGILNFNDQLVLLNITSYWKTSLLAITTTLFILNDGLRNRFFPEICSRVISLIKDMDALLKVLTYLNEENRSLLLETMIRKEKLLPLLTDTKSLGLLLKTLNGLRIGFFSEMYSRVIYLIKDMDALLKVLAYLNEENRSLLLETMIRKKKLLPLLTDTKSLGLLLNTLNDAQCNIVWTCLPLKTCKTMFMDKDNMGQFLQGLNGIALPVILKGILTISQLHQSFDIQKLQQVLAHLRTDQRHDFLQAMSLDIPAMLVDIDALKVLLNAVGVSKEEYFFILGLPTVQAKLSEIIPDMSALAEVFEIFKNWKPQYLDPILDMMQPQLIKTITEVKGLSALLQEFAPNLRLTRQVLKLLPLTELINDVSKFYALSEKLSDAQFEILLDTMVDHLSKLIDTTEVLYSGLQILSPQKRNLLLTRLPLSTLIDDVNMFFQLSEASDAQYETFLRSMGGRVAELLATPELLSTAGQILSPQKWELLFVALEKLNFPMIQDSNGLLEVLVGFEQNKLHYSIVKPLRQKLPFLIGSETILCNLLQQLNNMGRQRLDHLIVLEALKENLPKIIISEKILLRVLELTNEEGKRNVLYTLSIQLPELISSEDALCNLLLASKSTGQTALLDILKKQLPNLISSDKILFRILKSTDRQGQTIVLNNLSVPYLAALISSDDALFHLLQIMDRYSQKLLLNAMKMRWPTLPLLDKNALSKILPLLTQEDANIFLNGIRPRVSEWIPNVDILFDRLQSLSTDECKLVLNVLKADVLKVIKDVPSLLKVFQKFQNQDLVKRKLFCEAIFPFLDQILANGLQFSELMQQLNYEESTLLITVMKPKIPHLIHNVKELTAILSQIYDQSAQIQIINGLKDKIIKWMTTSAQLNEVLSPIIQNKVCINILLRQMTPELLSLIPELTTNIQKTILNNIKTSTFELVEGNKHARSFLPYLQEDTCKNQKLIVIRKCVLAELQQYVATDGVLGWFWESLSEKNMRINKQVRHLCNQVDRSSTTEDIFYSLQKFMNENAELIIDHAMTKSFSSCFELMPELHSAPSFRMPLKP